MMMTLKRRIKNLFTSREIVPEVLDAHRHRLPRRIGVTVKFDVATRRWLADIELPDSKDRLFTEANTEDELTAMVNDAVLTYFEVPYPYSEALGGFRHPSVALQEKKRWILA